MSYGVGYDPVNIGYIPYYANPNPIHAQNKHGHIHNAWPKLVKEKVSLAEKLKFAAVATAAAIAGLIVSKKVAIATEKQILINRRAAFGKRVVALLAKRRREINGTMTFKERMIKYWC